MMSSPELMAVVYVLMLRYFPSTLYPNISGTCGISVDSTFNVTSVELPYKSTVIRFRRSLRYDFFIRRRNLRFANSSTTNSALCYGRWLGVDPVKCPRWLYRHIQIANMFARQPESLQSRRHFCSFFPDQRRRC